MNTLTIHGFRPAARARQLQAGVGAPGVLGLVTRVWRYFQARRAMAQLGDDVLHDMGLGRSEIDAAVRHGRSPAWR